MEQEMPVAGVAFAAVAPPSDTDACSSTTAELRVVYLATAADTSCINHDDDSRQHTVVSVGDVSEHMTMDVDGSDSDDNDSTEVSRRSVTDVTAMMLQRN